MDKYKDYGMSVVRFGVSFVYLWFGISQLLNPSRYVFYLPDFIKDNVLNPEIFIYANGVFEIIFGSLLLLGVFVRLSSFLLAIHLFFITLSLGFTDIAARDFSIFLATTGVFLYGNDKLCSNKKIRKFFKKGK